MPNILHLGLTKMVEVVEDRGDWVLGKDPFTGEVGPESRSMVQFEHSGKEFCDLCIMAKEFYGRDHTKKIGSPIRAGPDKKEGLKPTELELQFRGYEVLPF